MTHRTPLASLLLAATLSCTPYPASQATPESVELAQVFGSVCVTQWGTCEVSPQPVGSVCFCGSAQGLIGQ